MDKFKEQCSSYIKFLMYHFVIVFTVVASLLSATEKIEGGKIRELVQEIRALQDTTGSIPPTDDYIINEKFFESSEEEIEYERLDDNEFSDSLKQISDEQKQRALERQKTLIAEVEKEVKTPFQFTLSFLGNITIDMRYWMFFMPLLLIISLVYIFILDYKITIEKQLLGKDKIPIREQYPFRFMRLLLLVCEGILFLLYIVVVFRFFDYTSPGLRNIVYKLFSLISYYAFIYCFYVKYILQREAFGYDDTMQNLRTYRYIRSAYSYLLKVMQKSFSITPKIRFGISQACLSATLLLVMSYSGCNESEQTPENLVKGFQLFTIDKQWEIYVDPFMSFILKYSYDLIIVLSTLLTTIIFFRKRIASFNNGLIRRGFFLTTFLFILFTVYFSNFNIISAWADFAVAVLIYVNWYHTSVSINNVNGSDNAFRYKSYLLLILYIIPFLPFLIVNIFDVFEIRNGWGPFYIGLWLLTFNLFGEVVLKNKKQE